MKGHDHEFVDACRGQGKTFSDFDIGGKLTEIGLSGIVALSHGQEPRLGRREDGGPQLPRGRSICSHPLADEMAVNPDSFTPRYRLLAIDVDGTLVNSSDELTPATQAATVPQGAGIHVVLATGRRYRHTLHLVEPLKISVPMVTAGGALVKDPATHKTLFKTEFDRKLAVRSSIHARTTPARCPAQC